MENAASHPGDVHPDLHLPVASGTVIAVDALYGLSTDRLVMAALDVWPVLREVVNSTRIALTRADPPNSLWEDRLVAAGLSADAIALLQRVIACLGNEGIASNGIGSAVTQADWPANKSALIDIALAAVVVDAIGPATWVCPSIPWPTRLDGQDVNALATLPADVARLCMGAVFYTSAVVNAPITPITPECAALMACLSAFSAGMPTHGRLLAQGLAETGAATTLTLRLLVISPVTEAADTVIVIVFDVDDQTPEDLAIGLDHIRDAPGVLSATVAITTAKKGRMSFKVEVLAQPPQAQAIIQCCLAETTTIGLRWHVAQRATLPRTSRIVRGTLGVPGGVKTVLRPGGQFSSKVEADVLAASGLDLVGRSRLRIDLEGRDIE